MNPFVMLLLIGVAVFALVIARVKDLWWLATLGLFCALIGLQSEWIFKSLPQSFFKAIPFSLPVLANWMTTLAYIGIVLLASLTVRAALLVIQKKKRPAKDA